MSLFDPQRLIIHHFQIANFYGATNDEFSQPRHCWDYCGKYIYGVCLHVHVSMYDIFCDVLKTVQGYTDTNGHYRHYNYMRTGNDSFVVICTCICGFMTHECKAHFFFVP